MLYGRSMLKYSKENLNFSQLYALLENTRKNNEEYYSFVRDLLKYLYSSVNNLSDLEMFSRLQLSSSDYSEFYQRMTSTHDELFSCVEDNGILSRLSDMLNNRDKRFINKFVDANKTFVFMANNHIYDERDYDINTYILNMYTMAKGYEYQKDNFDNFCAIVDDVSTLFINFIDDRKFFPEKIQIIDAFVSNPKYANLPNLRESLKKILKQINFPYSDDLINQYLNAALTANQVFIDADNFKKQHIDYDEDKVLEIANSVIAYSINTEKYMEYCMRSKPTDAFYSQILFFGNRFEYFRKKLLESEENPNIRREIFNAVSNLDYRLFNHLDKSLFMYLDIVEPDSFTFCMNALFDSDSYTELNRKLKALQIASDKYEKGENNKGFNEARIIIKNINDDKFKEEIDGQTMKYPNEHLIPDKKPNRIIDRMLDLYSKKISSLDDEQITTIKEKHQQVKSLSELNINTLEYIEKAQIPSVENPCLEKSSKKTKGLRKIFPMGGK